MFFETAGTDFSPAGLRDALLDALWVPGVSLGVAALASLLLPSVGAVRRHKEPAEALELAEGEEATTT